jgi:hypothetical protein
LFSAKRKDVPMFVATLTLALFGLVAFVLAELVRHDREKILAALQGRSWTAEPPQPVRPVTVRFSPRYSVSRPLRVLPELRAAA